jgi:hypothetical protein
MANILATNPGAPNGAPTYNLVKGDMLTIVVDAIVLSTDLNMQLDMMESTLSRRRTRRVNSRMRQWYNETWTGSNPAGPGAVSLTDAYNVAFNTPAGIGGLGAGICREAPGGLQNLLSATLSYVQII